MNRAEALKDLQSRADKSEALKVAIEALKDMEWLATKRPCDFCKHHKTIYEQEGYYTSCVKWECDFHAGKGEEEDRR